MSNRLPETAPYDILIQDATIVDGSGQPAYTGSVGIRGEKIAAVGELGDVTERDQAALVIDGRGLVACPGFIDPHSHADRGVATTPTADNLVMQGITTFLGDNCGFSSAPTPELGFAGWLEEAEAARPSVNYAPLVGHNTLRTTVMDGDWRRPATSDEVARMEALVEEAMQAGAYGLSDGLDAVAALDRRRGVRVLLGGGL